MTPVRNLALSTNKPTHRLKLLTQKGIVTLLVSDLDSMDDISTYILSEYGQFTQLRAELIYTRNINQ